MNPAKEREISQREKELRNLENNNFDLHTSQEEKLIYDPDLEELKKNTSLKPKIIKGFVFCK